MTILDNLTLEQKVGQLVHVGFDDTEPTTEIESLVDESHVGGIIYFARNIETPSQTRALSQSLQQTALESETGLPLFISADQEGGTVRRLPFYTDVPGQMAVGATGDPDAPATVAEITARQLRSVGINLNLAPVLDVNSNPKNPVIGVRSYGEDPDVVGEFGARSVEAFQSADVMACGKHFPGHGDTSTDSHADLPLVDASESRLESVELAPFKRAVEAGIDAIMTAHVAFPAITDSTSRPATRSRDVLTGCLRDELGFDGLIATDCMEMNAISEEVGTEQGAVDAVAAGADIVLVSHTLTRQRGAIEAVIEAVETGEIAEERIDESLERILAFKHDRALRPGPSESILDEGEQASNRERIRPIARDAVTLVRDETETVPYSIDESLFVIAARSTRGSPAEDEHTYVDTLVDALEDRGFRTTVTEFDTGDSLDASTLPADAQVLCCTADAARNPAQATVVETLLEEGVNPVVAAVRNPYDIHHLPSVGTYLTTYDPTSENLAALADVLAGDLTPRGRVLPSLR